MTKIKMFLGAALAAMVAFGVCAQAQDPSVGVAQHLRLASVGLAPTAAGPSITTQEMIGGSLTLGIIEPNPIWPCFTGTDGCGALPTGGYVFGIPYLSWSYSCSGPCAELTWWFQDGTVDTLDHLVLRITVKQGNRTVYDTGALDLGANPYPQQLVSTTVNVGFGPGWCVGGTTCSKPLTGQATMEATATVGALTATTRQTIDLQ